MKPGKIGIYLAVALLIMGFSYSGWQAFVHSSDESANSDVEVIRLAHWQLEPGVREAIDEIAADYMKLHPDVKVEQLPIPGKVWKQWLRTQLVGGALPT